MANRRSTNILSWLGFYSSWKKALEIIIMSALWLN